MKVFIWVQPVQRDANGISCKSGTEKKHGMVRTFVTSICAKMAATLHTITSSSKLNIFKFLNFF